MKTYLALYLIIIKILSGSFEPIKNTGALPANTDPNKISCHLCVKALNVGGDELYNADPSIFKTSQYCTDLPIKLDKNIYSCATKIMLAEDTVHKSKPDAKNIMIFLSSPETKKRCKRSSDKVVCLDSTCRELSVCCEEDLCNTGERLKLKLLALYPNIKDKILRNNYANYSKKKCLVNSKNNNDDRPRACIVATDKSDDDENTDTTNAVNNTVH